MSNSGLNWPQAQKCIINHPSSDRLICAPIFAARLSGVMWTRFAAMCKSHLHAFATRASWVWSLWLSTPERLTRGNFTLRCAGKVPLHPWHMLQKLVQETCTSDMFSCASFCCTSFFHRIECSCFPRKFVWEFENLYSPSICMNFIELWRTMEDGVLRRSVINLGGPYHLSPSFSLPFFRRKEDWRKEMGSSLPSRGLSSSGGLGTARWPAGKCNLCCWTAV